MNTVDITEPVQAGPARVPGGTLGRAAAQGTQLLGVGGFYLILVIFFAAKADNFLTTSNTVNILSNISILGVVALGQAIVLISGGFDLSVSGTVPLGGIIYVELVNHGHGVVPATLVAVAAGLVVGVCNGLIVTVLGINPLITTLATVSITGGLAFTVSNGLTVTLTNPADAPLGNNLWGMPLYVWTLILLAVIVFIALRYTIFGRMLYSVGGNREATRLAGIRVNAITIAVYVLSGILSSFAGVMLAHQLLAGAPTVGSTEGLLSITAVILGGASLSGGTGGIPGTLLGVLVIGTVSNGLALMQVPTFYQQIATGAILLLAVGLGRVRGLVERAIWARPRG
ncbi:MAG: inner-rane translocator [Nocardia sp.]|uniref:ABC transporter permease n=1 Tax=Nocardia sp. TaxID=1821 RepID=UPI00261A20D7|nr:ABC transporter permease [Nocardia sp.]MCU1648033.1 inner-rane translocator [Nocardia sp.]